MLKNIKNTFRRQKKSELNTTPGKNIKDAIIKAGIKTAEESGYAAGNQTEKNALALRDSLVKIPEREGIIYYMV